MERDSAGSGSERRDGIQVVKPLRARTGGRAEFPQACAARMLVPHTELSAGIQITGNYRK